MKIYIDNGSNNRGCCMVLADEILSLSDNVYTAIQKFSS